MKNILFLCFAFCTTLGFARTSDLHPTPCFHKHADLSAGTIVLLETNETFKSDDVTVGKVLQFRVRTNVMAEGEVVIQTGALAIGRVKAIESATHNSQEEIRFELEYVQAVDGQMVALNGNEQSARGQFTGQGTTVQIVTSITAQVMNNQKIKVN
jgi:hypothetical protein